MARTRSVTLENYTVGVKITGASTADVYEVMVRNMTTREFLKKKNQSTTEVVFDLADLTSDGSASGTKSGFSDADLIEVTCGGAGVASSTVTVSKTNKGGELVTLAPTAASSTNAPGVSF